VVEKRKDLEGLFSGSDLQENLLDIVDHELNGDGREFQIWIHGKTGIRLEVRGNRLKAKGKKQWMTDS